jgi:hypothetical protein
VSGGLGGPDPGPKSGGMARKYFEEIRDRSEEKWETI